MIYFSKSNVFTRMENRIKTNEWVISARANQYKIQIIRFK